MEYPSKLLEEAITQIARLPGIGKKSALRLALFLLAEEESATQNLTTALNKLRSQVKQCKKCYNIADQDLCNVCADKSRDKQTVCVVASLSDVIAIENTSQYRGLYHILGGLISPINGIGPEKLHIQELEQRVEQDQVKEVIMALSATMEADTTAFYIARQLEPLGVKVSMLARGVPVGSELEYTDEVTLGRSILQRTAYR